MENNFSKIDLVGLSKSELEAELLSLGQKPFRAAQIWNWIYVQGVRDFSKMQNLAENLRIQLAEKYFISRPEISRDLLSFDGTRKWLLAMTRQNNSENNKQEIETVFIPEIARGTLCVSSQIGCTLTCKFCHTGTQMLVRNLSVAEIIGQVMLVKDLLQDWGNHNNHPARTLTNIVFMGMGEPFYNYENVAKAIDILTDSAGLSFSRRKITVSTSGVVPEIYRFASEVKAALAVSLHSANDITRSEIMPINKKYPLSELMQACGAYCGSNKSQRITFEYVMLAGVNDSDEDARQLVKLLRDHKLSALVNLIPFNPWQGTVYKPSSRNRIMEFHRILQEAGFTAPIRKTRGEDVMAACGQLKSNSQRVKKNLKRVGDEKNGEKTVEKLQ